MVRPRRSWLGQQDFTESRSGGFRGEGRGRAPVAQARARLAQARSGARDGLNRVSPVYADRRMERDSFAGSSAGMQVSPSPLSAPRIHVTPERGPVDSALTIELS